MWITFYSHLVGEHSVKGDPASLYNLTKSDPDPLAELGFNQIQCLNCVVSFRTAFISFMHCWKSISGHYTEFLLPDELMCLNATHWPKWRMSVVISIWNWVTHIKPHGILPYGFIMGLDLMKEKHFRALYRVSCTRWAYVPECYTLAPMENVGCDFYLELATHIKPYGILP